MLFLSFLLLEFSLFVHAFKVIPLYANRLCNVLFYSLHSINASPVYFACLPASQHPFEIAISAITISAVKNYIYFHLDLCDL